MMFRLLTSVSVCVVLLGTTAPASAQLARPERPYRGLFASGRSDAGQMLTVNVSLAGGYDDDLRADAAGGSGGGSVRDGQQAGALGQLSGTLSYSLQNDSLSLSASTTGGARYYPSTEADFVGSSQTQANLAAKLSSRTSLSAYATAIVQPDTFAQLFATGLEPPTVDAPLPEIDTASTVDYYVAYDGGAGVSYNLSRDTTLNGNYGFRIANNRGTRGEFTLHRGNGNLTHQLRRDLAIRAGYGFTEAQYADGSTRPNHIIDAGADYNRTLSFSRRTTFAFGTGAAATESNETLRYSVVGNARLDHEIGRTWNAFGHYARRVVLHETWNEPVFADAFTATLAGLFNRRLQFTATAQVALGSVGTESGNNRFDTYMGTTALTYTLTRFASMALTYNYYRHRADEGVELPEGVPSEFDRQSIRLSVNLWAPLYERARRTNASR